MEVGKSRSERSDATRLALIGSARRLFGTSSYSEVSLAEIVEASGVTKGALYHHFPGGKDEIAAETIRWSGAMYALLLPAVFDPAPDFVTGVRDFYALAAVHLRESGWEDACPIATVALEVASTNEPLRIATAEVFDSWIDAATARGVREGLPEPEARRLGIAIIVALEGAFVLCRSLRSTEPLDVAGSIMVRAVQDSLTAHT